MGIPGHKKIPVGSSNPDSQNHGGFSWGPYESNKTDLISFPKHKSIKEGFIIFICGPNRE